MKSFKIINIIGVDGSGKTTLAKAIAQDFQKHDGNVCYKYCQYVAILLYPFKKLAKISLMRKTDEFINYDHYNDIKKKNSRRYPILANIYAGIWILDYLVQILFKITFNIMIGKRLILDRYFIDTAVNLSLTTNHEISYAEKVIRFFLKFVPEPDIVLLIDLPEQIAFNRKDDIPDLNYLRERRDRYRMLASTFDFIAIDGTKHRNEVMLEAKNILNDTIQK